MRSSNSGQRHVLLIPKRTMNRLWKWTFVLSLVLAIAGWLDQTGHLDPDLFPYPRLVFISTVLSFLIFLFAFLTRHMYYVQAHPDHLRISTPFLRLKISYRRLRAAQPLDLRRLYRPSELTWAEKRALSPFLKKTSLSVKLTSFPLSPAFLRLFLPKVMFLPGGQGLLLVVEDWMKLSTEIDTFSTSWQQKARL